MNLATFIGTYLNTTSFTSSAVSNLLSLFHWLETPAGLGILGTSGFLLYKIRAGNDRIKRPFTPRGTVVWTTTHVSLPEVGVAE